MCGLTDDVLTCCDCIWRPTFCGLFWGCVKLLSWHICWQPNKFLCHQTQGTSQLWKASCETFRNHSFGDRPRRQTDLLMPCEKKPNIVFISRQGFGSNEVLRNLLFQQSAVFHVQTHPQLLKKFQMFFTTRRPRASTTVCIRELEKLATFGQWTGWGVLQRTWWFGGFQRSVLPRAKRAEKWWLIPYKLSILGYPHFWKPPCILQW